MGLSRLLILIAVAALGYAVWMRLRGRPGDRAGRRLPEEEGRRMARCRHCGLFVPEDQAVRDAAGEPYCSPEHRDAAGDA